MSSHSDNLLIPVPLFSILFYSSIICPTESIRCYISFLSHCCDRNNGRTESIFCLTVLGEFWHGRGIMAGLLGGWSHCSHCYEAESNKCFLIHSKTQPHSGWVFPPPFTYSKRTPSQMFQNVCLSWMILDHAKLTIYAIPDTIIFNFFIIWILQKLSSSTSNQKTHCGEMRQSCGVTIMCFYESRLNTIIN